MKTKNKIFKLFFLLLSFIFLFGLIGCDKPNNKKNKENNQIKIVNEKDNKLIKEMKQEKPVSINKLLEEESILKDKTFVYKTFIDDGSGKREISESKRNIELMPPFTLYLDQREYSELEKLDKGKRLPNLEGLTKDEIGDYLRGFGLSVSLFFKEEKADGKADRFLRYQDNKIGDLIEPNKKVVIIISRPSDVKLPDISGLSCEEAKIKLEELYIPSEVIKISYVEKPNSLPKTFTTGTFIVGYKKHNVGDNYEINGLDSELIYLNVYKNEVYNCESIGDIKLTIEGNLLYKTNKEPIYIEDNEKEEDTLAYIKLVNKKTKEERILKNKDDTFTDEDIKTHDLILAYYKNTDTFYGYTKENQNEKALYISKIMHQTNGAKAIELYNPTDSDIDLSDYKIAIIAFEEYYPKKEIKLVGKLKPNKTYLIINRHHDATLNLGDVKDLETDELIFEGKDVIQLRKQNNTYIDTINNVRGSNTNILENELLIRREKELYHLKEGKYTDIHYLINHGVRDYNPDYFAGYISTYYAPLKEKKHPFIDTQEFDFEEFKEINFDNKTFESGGISEASIVKEIDGDTTYFKIDNKEIKFRYLYNDTPESYEENYQEAKSALSELLNTASKIYLSVGGRGYTSREKETYQRDLGYVWGLVDGKYICFNLEMLDRGWTPDNPPSKPMNYENELIYNNRYMYQLMREAAYSARINKKGLFKE